MPTQISDGSKDKMLPTYLTTALALLPATRIDSPIWKGIVGTSAAEEDDDDDDDDEDFGVVNACLGVEVFAFELLVLVMTAGEDATEFRKPPPKEDRPEDGVEALSLFIGMR